MLNILLMKINPEDVSTLEGMKTPLFDHIRQKKSASMKTYLDRMVKFEKSNSDSDDDLFFDVSLFDHTAEEKNHLDKHLELLETGLEELKHPLMELFMLLKHQRTKWMNRFDFTIYVIYLIIFSAHGLISINLQQSEELNESTNR